MNKTDEWSIYIIWRVSSLLLPGHHTWWKRVQLVLTVPPCHQTHSNWAGKAHYYPWSHSTSSLVNKGKTVIKCRAEHLPSLLPLPSFLTGGASWARQRSQECLLLAPRQCSGLRNVEEEEGEFTEKKERTEEESHVWSPSSSRQSSPVVTAWERTKRERRRARRVSTASCIVSLIAGMRGMRWWSLVGCCQSMFWWQIRKSCML